ncbi:K(+)/H(+) antiporter [Boothiomyces sp. JEL0866]|nr:K(+)/H(+) antiporter [Boothiomyces sp. JEL0866]
MVQSVASDSFLTGMNPLSQNISLFLTQMVIIVCTARIIKIFLQYLNQPSVISEVVGGIILGPTALSSIPEFQNAVFPTSSLPLLKLVADIGLILYLFMIGMELDPVKVAKEFKQSAAISLAGIVLPFGTGVGVAKLVYDLYGDHSVPFTSFVVFCGVAMSITAFPVLARILTERKLLGTSVGNATLAAAASDDAIAWSLLVLVVALINNPAEAINALWVFLLVVAWGIFLAFTARPLFVYLINASESENGATQFNVFVVFITMAISAFFTQAAGVDAIFGAFLVGLMVPHDKGFAIAMTEKIEDLVLILFLPLYFAYSGLNTKLGTLNDGQTWGVIFLIIVTACGGKILGCTFASRMAGMPWRESWTIGFLMNTKGLVEIIVLNLGLQAQVISPKIYAMFLIMALITTFMTVPIVSYIYPQSLYLHKGEQPSQDSSATLTKQPSVIDKMHILICLPSMKVVPAVMNLSQILFSSPKALDVYALRLIELGERMSKVMLANESSHTLQSDPVINILRTFGQLNKKSIKTLMSVSPHSNFSEDIVDAAATLESNLIIFPIEASPTTFPKGWAATTARQLWHEVPCPLAFFVDRGFGVSNFAQTEFDNTIANPGENQKVFFPFFGTDDDVEAAVILNYMAHAAAIKIFILQLFDPEADSAGALALEALGSFPNVMIEKTESKTNMTALNRAADFGKKDLIVIAYDKYEGSAEKDDTIKTYLEAQSSASYMIVNKPHYLSTNSASNNTQNSISNILRRRRKEEKAPSAMA